MVFGRCWAPRGGITRIAVTAAAPTLPLEPSHAPPRQAKCNDSNGLRVTRCRKPGKRSTAILRWLHGVSLPWSAPQQVKPNGSNGHGAESEESGPPPPSNGYMESLYHGHRGARIPIKSLQPAFAALTHQRRGASENPAWERRGPISGGK
jgi:hypothetical protein